MNLLSQKQPFRRQWRCQRVLTWEQRTFHLTCQLTRLERFSTTSLYSVLVGGPYLQSGKAQTHYLVPPLKELPHQKACKSPREFKTVPSDKNPNALITKAHLWDRAKPN
jgi:hypothetical protein